MNLKELTPGLRVILVLVLVGMILTTIVVLTLNDRDSAGVYAFGGSILIGLGLIAGVTGQVASNTNGNTTKLMEMIDSTQRQNATTQQQTAALLSLMMPNGPAAERTVIDMANAVNAPVSAPPAPVTITPDPPDATTEIPRPPPIWHG